MKTHIFKAILLFLSFYSFSQKKGNDTIIDADKLSDKQLSNIQKIVSKKGWVVLKTKEGNMISNYSNLDYVAYWYNCKSPSPKPTLLIEFSNHYGDGDYGGIDFFSTNKNDFDKVNYYLDDTDFKNPFKNFEKNNFKKFYSSLKTAKILTIKFYNKNQNFDTGKDELKLNRSIEFKLAHGQFLDLPVICK
jgi:hypothetical protein